MADKNKQPENAGDAAELGERVANLEKVVDALARRPNPPARDPEAEVSVTRIENLERAVRTLAQQGGHPAEIVRLLDGESPEE